MIVDYFSGNKLIASRAYSFDALKLFTIILVIWGHCIQYFLSSHYANEPMYRFIYSFHMPLFMVISGYFAESSMKLDLIHFLIKKSKLLLPCLSWGILIWLVLDVLFPLSKQRSLSLNQLLYSLFFGFWFLKSVFLCYIMVYCGKKTGISKFIWIPLTLLFSKWISHYNMEYMYPCFLVGMALRKVEWKNKVVSLFFLSLFIFLFLLCFWDESFWEPMPGLRTAFLEGNIVSFMTFVYKYLFRIIIGISGSFTFIFLFHFLFERKKLSKSAVALYSWGQYTLEIYVVQTIVVEMIMARYIVLDNLNFVAFNFVVAPFLTLLILVACMVIIKMIYKSGILGFWLFGKS